MLNIQINTKSPKLVKSILTYQIVLLFKPYEKMYGCYVDSLEYE